MVNIEINDMPVAVRQAWIHDGNPSAFFRYTVSSIMDDSKPDAIATIITPCMPSAADHDGCMDSVYNIPRSPMEQPTRHRKVLTPAARHVLMCDQNDRDDGEIDTACAAAGAGIEPLVTVEDEARWAFEDPLAWSM